MLYGEPVVWVGGSDEMIVVDIGSLCQANEVLTGLVAECLRVHSCLLRRLLHFHTMLVGACAEQGLSPSESMPSFQDVNQDEGVQMSHMRRYIKSAEHPPGETSVSPALT